MALPTYLELVNDVLVRLREPTVASVSQNVMSSLIGKFINDAKNAVENAYTWNALTDTMVVTTEAGIFNYTLVDSGARFKVIDAFNLTSKVQLTAMKTKDVNRMLTLGGSSEGSPTHYNFNGIDNNGDTNVDIVAIPDGVYSLYFNLYIPDPDLTDDTDQMWVPKEPVINLAYAKALVERGEDGGLGSSEAFQIAKSILSDHIAIEEGRYPDESTWEAT